jgi:hypothetical protein
MQPFDYRQQVVNPFEQAIQGAARGFQLGTNIRAIQEQRQAALEQRQAEMLARQQQEELQAEINQLVRNPNPTFVDYERIAARLPKDAAEGLRKNYEARTEESKRNEKRFSGQVVAALSSPNEDSRKRGIALLRERAQAERNAGNTQDADAYDVHARIAETGEDGAKAVVDEVMVMGATTFGKDWAEGILKVRAEPGAGFRPVTAAERTTYGLPAGVPFQVGPDGKITEVTRGPLAQVTVDTGKREAMALKELDVPRAKEFSDAAASARQLARDSRVISNLLKGKGGGAAIKLTTDLMRNFGFETDTVAANDLANALATRGAVQIRAPGSGGTSDLEFRSYLQAFPSLSNTERGRELMAKYAEAFAKRSARLADHARKLIREDRYSEEEIARFDESLGPILGDDFYELARPGRRPGVAPYTPAAPGRPAAAPATVPNAMGQAVDQSVRSRADAIIRGQ